MDTLGHILNGFNVALMPINLWYTFLGCFMGTIIGILPGIELSAKTAMVPVLSLSLVCKEMLSGVWHWNFIALIFGSSCLYAAIALGFAVRMFNREDVMFRA